MVRRLTLLLMLTVMLIPGSVFALGLGEIHLKSALNQAFDAKIDLLSVQADELDGVKVTLATPEAFDRAGVDRLFILTKLQYKPDLNEEGKPVIHVTSRQAIHEPFLNFLVEVNWAKGRLIREYTVLLDPPVTLDRKPSPVKAPITEAHAPTASPVSSGVQSRPMQVAGKPAEGAVLTQAGADEYGPVMANESLWKIANRTKPQGATVEQMMMALQRKNPHAFFRQNVNNLKRGSILRMPTQEEIDFLSVLEARVKFSNQVVDWKANQATAPTSDVGGAPGIVTDTKQSAPVSKLKLASVRPEGEGKGGVSEGDGTEELTSKLENELILAREQFESAKQERNELGAQVSELESQLTDLESLLAVRNEQLARLQNELQKPDVDVAQQDVAQQVDEIPTEVVADVESEAVEVEEKAEGVGEQVAEESKALDVAVTQPEEAAPEPEKVSPAEPAEPTTTEAAASESILDILIDQLENNTIAVAGGGLVLLLLLLLLARRRSTESEEFEESILVGARGEDSESLSSAGDDTVMSGAAETSFLSEFSHSDMDVLQDDTGEVDPVAEADVYIAYGRYQQAEELLRQAIDCNPDHFKCYLKLLEILFVTKNAPAFTEIAEALVAKSPEQTDTDAWQQVVTMGHQLDPTHELFGHGGDEGALQEGGQPAAVATEAESEATADEQDEDLDLLGISDLTADFDSDADILGQQDGSISTLLEDDSLDFDLNLGLDADSEGTSELAGDTDVDDILLNADISEVSAEAGSDDELMDLSAEQPDSSISELEVEKESIDLEESLSLDELDLGDSEDEALEVEEAIQVDDLDESLGGSDDLAAALSSFTDEPIDEKTSDNGDLAAALDTSADEIQDASFKAQELEEALTEFPDDLPLGGSLETDGLGDLGDLGAELESLAADFTAEDEDNADLAVDLEGIGELDDLTSSDLEQEVSKLEDVGDQDDMLADVSFDDLDLGELSVPEDEDLEMLETGGDLSDLSDEDLMIGDEFSSEVSVVEPLSELLEEPDKIDEVNTKLDLARAYVEMGDEEGARSILDEVLNEGDDMQKKDAEELLGRLS